MVARNPAAVSESSGSTTLKRLMIFACFSIDRTVLSSQEIGDSVGLLAVTVELLTVSLVGLGLIAEDASGVYHFPGHSFHLEVKDQR
jgi:hypothetical protein